MGGEDPQVPSAAGCESLAVACFGSPCCFLGAVISDVDGYHGEGMLRRVRGRLLRPAARSRRSLSERRGRIRQDTVGLHGLAPRYSSRPRLRSARPRVAGIPVPIGRRRPAIAGVATLVNRVLGWADGVPRWHPVVGFRPAAAVAGGDLGSALQACVVSHRRCAGC